MYFNYKRRVYTNTNNYKRLEIASTASISAGSQSTVYKVSFESHLAASCSNRVISESFTKEHK